MTLTLDRAEHQADQEIRPQASVSLGVALLPCQDHDLLPFLKQAYLRELFLSADQGATFEPVVKAARLRTGALMCDHAKSHR